MSVRRLLAVVWRESVQVARDPFLLTAAFVTPCLLMVALGYGLSIDIEGLPFGVLDHDATAASRRYVQAFQHSRYFGRARRLQTPDELEDGLEDGSLAFAIEIGTGFQRRLERAEEPPLSIWIDGALPFRAETAQAYVEGVSAAFLLEQRPRALTPAPRRPVRVRYWYNESIRSRLAFVPSLVAALLAIIPPLLTAIAVVREKELGSIANLYATPLRRSEFLLGKQIPYALVSLLAFVLLFALAVGLFRVPFRGSFAALAMGAVLYVGATTAFGLVISSFTRTEVAALLVTVILTLLPAFLYSGFFTPVASLSGVARGVAASFPAAYFVDIAVGTFTKGLSMGDLWPAYLALAGFWLGLDGLALALLPEQER